MDRPENESPLSSGDGEHLTAATALGPGQLAHVERGLWALAETVRLAPQPYEQTFPNDFSSIVCFARAVRQLRACVLLAMFGYYEESIATMRGAYESASLGRLLAKDERVAERWLNDNEWFPDRKVRAWIEETRGPGSSVDYGRYYRMMSTAVHPTARATLTLLDIDGDRWGVRVDSRLDESALNRTLDFAIATTSFVCRALIRAAASPDVVPPAIRRVCDDLLATCVSLTGDTVEGQPDEEWDVVEERYAAYLDRIRAANELAEEMRTHPNSWTNLKREIDQQPSD